MLIPSLPLLLIHLFSFHVSREQRGAGAKISSAKRRSTTTPPHQQRQPIPPHDVDNDNGIAAIVTCWDDCFDPSALDVIKSAGMTRSHGFTSVFDRRQELVKVRSPLERAIVSLLETLEQQDETLFHKQRFVEYWWRDKARMLEAHRDIDEEYCRKNQMPVSLGSHQKIGKQRCPSFGHVLYVDVIASSSTKRCQAPTLVWQEEGGFATVAPRRLEKLFTVPAVSNRLLRFRGDCLHAVAHPPLAFLVDSTRQAELAKKHLEEDIYTDCRRAVLLFNTWEQPPVYPAVGEPLALEKINFENLAASKQFDHWNKQTMLFGKESWSSNETKLTRISVPLLGGVNRRGCESDSLEALVDETSAVRALTSDKAVHCLTLHPETTRYDAWHE